MTTDTHSRDALQDALQAIGATFSGNAFRCLWHDDRSPSAGIYAAPDGHWRYKCHGCDAHGDVLDLEAAATNTTPADLMRAAKAAKATPKRLYGTLEDCIAASAAFRKETPAGTFLYRSADGQSTLRAVTRMESGDVNPDTRKARKTFHQAHPTASGWVGSKPPGMQPIYHLPEITDAVCVVVCEGERKADALIALGLVATTSPGGAKNAKCADWSPLAGKRVVIWPDHDDDGAAYAESVAGLLKALPTPPAHLALINPADLGVPHKGDAIDFLAITAGDKRDAVIGVLRNARKIGSQMPIQDLLSYFDSQASGSYYLAPWPFPMLTAVSRSLLPGKVTILAGAPGGAKSWFVLQTILGLIGNGVPSAVMALEEPWPWHAARALAHLEGNARLLNNEWVKANKTEADMAAIRHGEILNKTGAAFTCRNQPTFSDCAQWVEDRAAAGVRVMIIDPITLADYGSEKSWDADRRFMARVKAALEKHGASLLVITHPRKSGSNGPSRCSMDDMAGGTTYQRAAASVLWLSNLATPERKRISLADGTVEQREIHKEISILKARDSTGCGSVIGYRFVGLRFEEQGKIVEDA
jgi:hypothetical protein